MILLVLFIVFMVFALAGTLPIGVPYGPLFLWLSVFVLALMLHAIPRLT